MTPRIGIRRLRLLKGAREANGHAVIIDVLRAGTSCAFALARGAERVVLVGAAQEALDLRSRRYPTAVLVGEAGGRAIEGFDLDNSPTLLERAELAGRTVILRTSSGTQGVLAARAAEATYLAAFVNAATTVRALHARGALVASLVAMGTEGVAPAEEDEACAAYLESLLRENPLPGAALLADVRERLPPDHPAPTWREDVARGFVIDRFDFAIEVVREDGLAIARQLAFPPREGRLEPDA